MQYRVQTDCALMSTQVFPDVCGYMKTNNRNGVFACVQMDVCVQLDCCDTWGEAPDLNHKHLIGLRMGLRCIPLNWEEYRRDPGFPASPNTHTQVSKVRSRSIRGPCINQFKYTPAQTEAMHTTQLVSPFYALTHTHAHQLNTAEILFLHLLCL